MAPVPSKAFAQTIHSGGRPFFPMNTESDPCKDLGTESLATITEGCLLRKIAGFASHCFMGHPFNEDASPRTGYVLTNTSGRMYQVWFSTN